MEKLNGLMMVFMMLNGYLLGMGLTLRSQNYDGKNKYAVTNAISMTHMAVVVLWAASLLSMVYVKLTFL